MSKHSFCRALFFISILFIPSDASAGVRPKAEITKLKHSYGANEWHMQRFIGEYVLLERQFESDPKNPEFIKRTRALKIQIDLLTRENELILNSLDQIEK